MLKRARDASGLEGRGSEEEFVIPPCRNTTVPR